MYEVSANSANAIESILDKHNLGLISRQEAHIQIIRAQRYTLVTTRLPREVRNDYMAGVKAGQLGHVKKNGHKPEAFFHPTFEHIAVAARNKKEAEVRAATRKMFVTDSHGVSA